jgi:hypothetical protein
MLAILFRLFGLLAPSFGDPVQALWFSCSQIVSIMFKFFALLVKPKGLNRIDKIWEQENQRA